MNGSVTSSTAGRRSRHPYRVLAGQGIAQRQGDDNSPKQTEAQPSPTGEGAHEISTAGQATLWLDDQFQAAVGEASAGADGAGRRGDPPA